jgi:hypothetical protein
MQRVAHGGGEMSDDRIAEEIAKLREEIVKLKRHAIIAYIAFWACIIVGIYLFHYAFKHI